MSPQRRIIDNRVFLLALDELYRQAMKEHERNELLYCARDTATALSVGPADVPVEGYYTENEQLTEYFRLMRALQSVPKSRAPDVVSLEGYKRLRKVTESGLFGPASGGPNLLNVAKDSLSVALEQTFPQWSIDNLRDTAYLCALNSDDFSLVALAALSRDPIVLAALRESVVLYAMAYLGCAMNNDSEYVWDVDPMVESRARRFVDTFNELFDECLPQPGLTHAETFWDAYEQSEIFGRCVRIGSNDSVRPINHYHWAIDIDTHHELMVRDFWDAEIWTTQRYREEMESRR